jgi:hypothetical protein
LPDEIIPKVVAEDEWVNEFKECNLDLIVDNMTMHWSNDVGQYLENYRNSL